MPVFAKGNQCVMGSFQKIDMVGETNWYLGLTLGRDSVFAGAARSNPLQVGKLKALNVHVNTNTSAEDIKYSFSHRNWNGAGWDSATDFLILTIPAGETGYFCTNLSESQTDTAWNPRDYVAVRQNRSSSVGSYKDLTIGMCFEITETTLSDTSGTNREPL